MRGYSVMIGRELRLSEAELDQLNWAALLHDVGKLEIPTEILNKPGRPSEDEWQQLQRHPLYGEMLVEPMRPWLGEWADAVGYHHERWDGQGYPPGVAGEDIPLPGRIVAIADVFDVITSARSYKAPGSPAAGREEIAALRGRAVRPAPGARVPRRLARADAAGHGPAVVAGASADRSDACPSAPVAGTVWGAAGVLVAMIGQRVAGTDVATRDADALARTPVAVQQRAAAAPASGGRGPEGKRSLRRGATADDAVSARADAGRRAGARPGRERPRRQRPPTTRPQRPIRRLRPIPAPPASKPTRPPRRRRPSRTSRPRRRRRRHQRRTRPPRRPSPPAAMRRPRLPS